MALICLIVVSLLAIIGDHGIQSSTSHGPCQNAQLGMQYAKCEVQCNPDGSCTETLSTEVCCSHSNTFHNSFSVLAKGYRNGVRVSRKKRQVSGVCENLAIRCSQCNGGFGRSAQAQGWESYNCNN